MDGIGIFILACFLVTFGPPLVFLILGFVKRKTQKDISTLFFILGAMWLIVGGGICASILAG